MWHCKTGKSGASSVKLCSLPPTSDAFIENVHRGHLQVVVWKAALQELPPNMDPTKYGWKLDHERIPQPRTVPPGTLLAPPEILQLIRCSCQTSRCRTAACSCSKLRCTIFCACEGGQSCENPLTQRSSELLLLLVCVSFTIIGQPRNSVLIRRV